MSIFDIIARMAEENREFIVATVIATSGSSPGKENFKALIGREGLLAGTIGGGRLEKTAIDDAQRLLADRANLVKTYQLTSGPDNIGMSCGGSATIVFEYVGLREQAIVFGGGHVSQSLTPLLHSIGFHVTLVENRPEFATRTLHPLADEIRIGPYTEAAVPDGAYVVIVTHSHEHDREILRAMFRSSAHMRFLGVIASKRKAILLREELERDFPGDVRIAELHAPCGLAIGGETHQQIALSIAAQMQAVKFGKLPVQG